MRKTIFLILMLSINSCKKAEESRTPSSVEGSSSIEQEWQKRGLQARENLENIGDRKSASDKCIKDFERAFYYHTIPEHAALLRGVQPLGVIYSFNIAHVSEIDNKHRYLKVTLVNFYYDNDGQLFKVDIPILAAGWRIQMSQADPKGFLIDNNKCFYFIDITNPFNSSVVDMPGSGKDI